MLISYVKSTFLFTLTSAILLNVQIAAANEILGRGKFEKIFTIEELVGDYENVELSTATYWSDVPQVFKGPYLGDLLDVLEINSDEPFEIYALDGYSVRFESWNSVSHYQPIVAIYADGRPLDEKYGPFFLVADLSDSTPMEDNLWVWAIRGIKLSEPN